MLPVRVLLLPAESRRMVTAIPIAEIIPAAAGTNSVPMPSFDHRLQVEWTRLPEGSLPRRRPVWLLWQCSNPVLPLLFLYQVSRSGSESTAPRKRLSHRKSEFIRED